MAIGETSYGENVGNLIEQAEAKFCKSPRYRSIHTERTRLEIARSKSAHKTLGLAKTPLNPPNDFLKKRSRPSPKPRPEDVQHTHYRVPGYIHQLPEWKPVKKPRPVTVQDQLRQLPRDPASVAKVNFRKRNVEEAKKLKPKRPRPRCVDTRRGDVQDLIASGLMPRYVYKKSYGTIPESLHLHSPRKVISPLEMKSKTDHKSGTDSKYQTEPVHKKSACRYITEDERARILQEMKNTWAELMKQFQCLPFLIDTPPKVKRKTKMEEKLKQLEKDIELIENHQYIYVYDK